MRSIYGGYDLWGSTSCIWLLDTMKYQYVTATTTTVFYLTLLRALRVSHPWPCIDPHLHWFPFHEHCSWCWWWMLMLMLMLMIDKMRQTMKGGIHVRWSCIRCAVATSAGAVWMRCAIPDDTSHSTTAPALVLALVHRLQCHDIT